MCPQNEYDFCNDAVASFTLNENVRGRFARIDTSLSTILSQQNYPKQVTNLMAEAILLTVMIGQAIKLRWKLSVQIRGSGAIKLIAVDYFSPETDGNSAKIRAYAKFDFQALENNINSEFNLLGKGLFAVLIDQGQGTEPYQGITPLTGGSLAKCAEMYFEQSEQLLTAFKIVVGVSNTPEQGVTFRGGGIMLQKLPNRGIANLVTDRSSLESNSVDSNAKLELPDDEIENWSRVNILMNTVEEIEIIGPQLTLNEVLHRLFHQESLVLFESQKLKFGCSCSIEKVSNALSIYSSKDINSMINSDGKVTADCQFCGEHYVLCPTELGFESKV
jgi:molecular chaperone Hsp33